MNPKNICGHPRSSAVQKSHLHSASDSLLWLCALLAIAMHGAFLFAWRYSPEESAAATIEGDSVEVSLVESAAAASAAVAEPQPPAAKPEAVPEPMASAFWSGLRDHDDELCEYAVADVTTGDLLQLAGKKSKPQPSSGGNESS